MGSVGSYNCIQVHLNLLLFTLPECDHEEKKYHPSCRLLRYATTLIQTHCERGMVGSAHNTVAGSTHFSSGSCSLLCPTVILIGGYVLSGQILLYGMDSFHRLLYSSRMSVRFVQDVSVASKVY